MNILVRKDTHLNIRKRVLYARRGRDGLNHHRSLSKYRKQEAANERVVPICFCTSLKVDRITSGRLQGGFAECLGQRWL